MPLKKVMAAFGLPFPLRRLLPYAIAPAHWGAIRLAATCPASALSQAIPEKPGAQAKWLRAIETFGTHWSRRGRLPYDPRFIEWIVARIGTDNAAASNLADFMIAVPERFDTRWSIDEAKAAMGRWHAEQANLANAERFARQFGVEFEERVDYPGFPDRIEINGLEFIALRSGAELFLEGKAMRHCVFSYVGSTFVGVCRIFSIRRDGRRVATLEMATDPNRWDNYQPKQLRGPCNATRLPSDVKQAVEKFSTLFAVNPLATPESPSPLPLEREETR